MRLPLYRLTGALKVTDGSRMCQVITQRPNGSDDECRNDSSFLATVICKTCGLREVFVCLTCLGQVMEAMQFPGYVCCKEQSPRHEVVAVTHARPVMVGKF
jgi:hypothetical protein